jgi:peptide/nickel transport system permease protein
MATAPEIAVPVPPSRRHRGWAAILRQAASLPRGRAGLGVMGAVVAVAIVGPFVAPHSVTASIVAPFARPSGQAVLGGDVLGRDVLSRVLDGGWVLLGMAAAATALGVAIGMASGVAAGYL